MYAIRSYYAIMLLGAQSLGTSAPLGIAGMVFSVTAYSASAVAIKRIGADIPALATTIGGLAVTVTLLLAVYYLTGEPLPRTIPVRTAVSIVYLGIIGSVLGFALYYYVLRHVEATRVRITSYNVCYTKLLRVRLEAPCAVDVLPGFADGLVSVQDVQARELIAGLPNARFLATGGDNGFCVAHNRAAAVAKGKYLYLFSTDTWLEPDS